MTTLLSSAGFWSYAHLDDNADGGRITRLAEKIQLEYQALTTRELKIFIDRDDIAWGEEWRSRIDRALQETTFYIPIITPNFVDRTECRNEFLNFVNAAKSLGVSEYILAIRYIPVPGLETDTDEVKELVAKTQYEDWTELRFEEEDSAPYRRAVHRVATRLKDLTELVESRPSNGSTTADLVSSRDTDDDDLNTPGLIDLVAEFEPGAAAVAETLKEFPALMRSFTETLNVGSALLSNADGSGKPFAHRIPILRKTATELTPYVDELQARGTEYIQKVMDLDPAVRAVIDVSRYSTTIVSQAEVSPLHSSILELQRKGKETANSVAAAGTKARELSKLSRDLRPVLRGFEAAMRSIVDGQNVIDEWAKLASEIR